MSIIKIFKKIRYSLVNNPYLPHLTNEEYCAIETYNKSTTSYASINTANGVEISLLRNFTSSKYGINKIYLQKINENCWNLCANSWLPELRNVSVLSTWYNTNLRQALGTLSVFDTFEIERRFFLPTILNNILDKNNIPNDEIESRFAIFKDLNDGAKITTGFINEFYFRVDHIGRAVDQNLARYPTTYLGKYSDTAILYYGQRNKITERLGFVIHTKDSPEIANEINNMRTSLKAIGLEHAVFINNRSQTIECQNNNENIVGNGNNLDIIVYRMYKSKYNENEINF